MADLGEHFDPQAVPERENNFEPIPAGLYEVHITESDVVDLKSGNGRSLVLTFEIVSGPYQGRKLWDRLNIQHNSQEAQAIAQRALADLFLATATAPSRNSEDLHFKPLIARVAIDAKDPAYAPKNVIKADKPRNGAPPAAKPASPAARSCAAPGRFAPRRKGPRTPALPPRATGRPLPSSCRPRAPPPSNSAPPR